ncbi:hypothetical protein PF003_g13446 [Phytophthora fragariae]|nr:hypothetical protein PF003_g13446 [Phytophthora fragariae]
MMKRMEDLEAREAAGEGAKDDEEEEESTEAQAAALKAKGNDAFSRRWFQASNQYYSQAIELDPTSHILNGNRAAAYHRLKKHKLALEGSNVARSNRSSESHVSKRLEQLEDQTSQASASAIGS